MPRLNSDSKTTITIASALTLPCGVTLPNRIGKAAMSEQLGELNGAPSATLARLYRAWGRGGAGLLIFAILAGAGYAAFSIRNEPRIGLRLAGLLHPAADGLKTIFKEVATMDESLLNMKGSLRSFSYYVPRDLVRNMLESGQEATLQGQTREMTIYFSDIAGMTSLSETMTPDALVQLLSLYFDGMTEVIAAQGGTVDKFIGDAIMAFWGAPAPTVATSTRTSRSRPAAAPSRKRRARKASAASRSSRRCWARSTAAAPSCCSRPSTAIS